MLRIMIVDDEALPRIALRNIVEKEHIFIGEAASGTDAEALALKTRPDVILLDIIMPDFDGFELIGRLSPRLPDTRYLIISNVENNDYLKKAIRAHVGDYLIKGTVNTESLLQALDVLENEIKSHSADLSDSFSEEDEASSAKNLLPILDGDVSGEAEMQSICSKVGFPDDETSYFCVRFHVTDRSRKISSRSIRLMIREILDDSGEGRTLTVGENDIAALFSPPAAEDAAASVGDFAERVIHSVQSSFGATVSCGISRFTSGYSSLRKAYFEAGEALSRSFFSGLQTINFFAVPQNGSPRKDALSLSSMVQNALNRDSAGEPATLMALLKELKTQAKDSCLQKEFILGLYYDVLYYAFSVVKKREDSANQELMLSRLSACPTLDELHRESIDILIRFSQMDAVPGNESTVIRQIKDYVDEHIQDQLSLEEIAEHVYMNPTYLSQLFRKKTGEKLRSYIVTERIRKAKRFLEEGRSIHETAMLTGFASDSYFIQCFKDATLTTPREYMRNMNMCDLGCR